MWSASRPAGQLPWAPHTQHTGRSHTLAPNPCRCLEGTAGPSLASPPVPPPWPSPAPLPPRGPPPVPTRRAARPASWARSPPASPGRQLLSLHTKPQHGHHESTATETAAAQPPGSSVPRALSWAPRGGCPVPHAQRQARYIYDLKEASRQQLEANVTIPALQRRTLRLRELRSLRQGHGASIPTSSQHPPPRSEPSINRQRENWGVPAGCDQAGGQEQRQSWNSRCLFP